MIFIFGLESLVGSLYDKTLIYFVDYDNMLYFCLRSIFMNGIHFYFKTTSKIVVTLLFLTKKLRELDLALPEKTRSLNCIKISLIQTQFPCKRLCKFRSRSLGRYRESHVFKAIEFWQLKVICINSARMLSSSLLHSCFHCRHATLLPTNGCGEPILIPFPWLANYNSAPIFSKVFAPRLRYSDSSNHSFAFIGAPCVNDRTIKIVAWKQAIN